MYGYVIKHAATGQFVKDYAQAGGFGSVTPHMTEAERWLSKQHAVQFCELIAHNHPNQTIEVWNLETDSLAHVARRNSNIRKATV